MTSSTDHPADIGGQELADEMKSLRHIYFSQKPVEILAYLSTNERFTALPNYFVELRIFLTIPFTVASAETNLLMPQTDQELLEVNISRR